MPEDDLARLIGILRLAYSGELAAGLAYHGHWSSLSDPEERARIRQIEDEEWQHRRLVGGMLADLGSRPGRAREARAWLVGRSLGALCHVMGWFAPMYGAGRLESRNIKEYEDAARFAEGCGHPELVDCLLTMAEVEWDHERYFRSKVEGRALTRLLGLWPQPPARETIRAGRPTAPAPARSVA